MLHKHNKTQKGPGAMLHKQTGDTTTTRHRNVNTQN